MYSKRIQTKIPFIKQNKKVNNNFRLNNPFLISEHSGEVIKAATRIIQSSSNELSTLVSDSAKCKQTKVNT